MRVLLDECVPRPLGRHLAGHEWSTVPKEGFAGVKNGPLFTAVQSKWDVLLTTDKSILWQEVVARNDIAVVVIRARSNDINDLLPRLNQLLQVVSTVRKGEAVEVGAPGLFSRRCVEERLGKAVGHELESAA